MELVDLITEVYSITGRPDRVSETLSGIKAATLKCHHSDYYTKDILETGLQFATSDYLQNWDYRNTVPYFRSAKYFRKYDVTVTPPVAGIALTKVVPENLFDSYGIEKADIWYSAGAFIQIKSSTQESTYLVGCYVNPIMTASQYVSWISQDHPYAIIFEAAATVFKAIGKDEEAAAMRQLVAEQIAIIKMSNIDSIGY